MSNNSCHNCGWNNSGNDIIICCNKDQKMLISISLCWKSKEKEMEKIQMNEEQASKFYDDNDLDSLNGIIKKKHFIEKLKNTGYIKKSALEIAEENYNMMFEKVKNQMGEFNMYPEYHILITEQKKEITRLKGETNQ